MPKGLMFSAKEYLLLVDETGRIIRDDKRGAINQNSMKILKQGNRIKLTTEFTRLFKGPLGTLQELDAYCVNI